MDELEHVLMGLVALFFIFNIAFCASNQIKKHNCEVIQAPICSNAVSPGELRSAGDKGLEIYDSLMPGHEIYYYVEKDCLYFCKKKGGFNED